MANDVQGAGDPLIPIHGWAPLVLLILILPAMAVWAIPVIRKSLPPPPPPTSRTTVRIAISLRPAFERAVMLNDGMRSNTSSPFGKKNDAFDVEFLDLDHNQGYEDQFVSGLPDAPNLIWSTVDYLPVLLGKCVDCRVVFAVAESFGADRAVPNPESPRQLAAASFIVPTLGSAHRIMDESFDAFGWKKGDCSNFFRVWSASDAAMKLKEKGSQYKGAVLSGLELARRLKEKDTASQKVRVVELLVGRDGYIQDNLKLLAELAEVWLGDDQNRQDVSEYFRTRKPFYEPDERIGKAAVDTTTWYSQKSQVDYFCGHGNSNSNFALDFQAAQLFYQEHPQNLIPQTSLASPRDVLAIDVLKRLAPRMQDDNGFCETGPKARILFQQGSDKLFPRDDQQFTRDQAAQLALIGDFVSDKRKHSLNLEISIEGFASADGDVYGNSDLSTRRANSIREYLKSQYRLKGDISVVGKGPQSGDWLSVAQLNRRGDVYIRTLDGNSTPEDKAVVPKAAQ